MRCRGDGHGDARGAAVLTDVPGSEPAGVVYSAIGEFYIGEAVRSAESSLRHNHIPHVLFADGEPATPLSGLTVLPFTSSGNPYADKIANMRRSPFERTLYLDSDTYVVDEIVHVLELLEHYDLAAAFASGYRGLADPGVPKSFHEFNTGVLAWRRSSRTEEFMAAWQATYETWLREEPFPGARMASRTRRADQPAFRHCAWEHALSVFVLTPEYNFRPDFPEKIVDRVRVIHGEHPAIGDACGAAQRTRGKATFVAAPAEPSRADRSTAAAGGRPDAREIVAARCGSRNENSANWDASAAASAAHRRAGWSHR